MTAHPPTPDYETPPSSQRRSLGTWAALLVVWSIGLVSWAAYGVAAIYLLTKVM